MGTCSECLSANDKANNEISAGIYLRAEEKPGKSQLGDFGWRLCGKSSFQTGSLTLK